MECGRLLERTAANLKRKTRKGAKGWNDKGKGNGADGADANVQIPQTMSECASALEGTGLVVKQPTTAGTAVWAQDSEGAGLPAA